MKTIKASSQVIIIMCILSFMLTAYGITIASEELIAGSSVFKAWMLIYSILVTIWVTQDTLYPKEQKYPSYVLLILIFWPLVLLYHLIKSRGTDGFVTYMGFWAIYVCPNFFSIIVNYYV